METFDPHYLQESNTADLSLQEQLADFNRKVKLYCACYKQRNDKESSAPL